MVYAMSNSEMIWSFEKEIGHDKNILGLLHFFLFVIFFQKKNLKKGDFFFFCLI